MGNTFCAANDLETQMSILRTALNLIETVEQGDQWLSGPEPVPTLRYVFTNEKHQLHQIIANPYLPATVRNVVIRRDAADLARRTIDFHPDMNSDIAGLVRHALRDGSPKY